jgi:transposase
VSTLPPSHSPEDSPEVTALKRELHWAHLKIEVLEERLRLQRIAKYGPASDKLSNAQLQLLEDEPGVCAEEVVAEAGRDPEPAASAGESTGPGKPVPERKKHPGRQDLPAHLPRKEKVIAVPEAECQCSTCGAQTQVIGHETSESLDVEPARYFVCVSKREKRACAKCASGGVKTAAAESKIIEKSLVSNRIIVETIIAKYSDHLPLYRQSGMLLRDAGVEISRATMDGWVMRVGELLIPLVAAMGRQLVSGTYIQADETPVEVQVRSGKGRNHLAYLWQYSTLRGEVIFDFQMGRGRDGPRQFLREFRGKLQTDGYAAYAKVGRPEVVHAACWAHARRKFVDACKVNKQDAVARRIVARMDELFALDSEAKRGQLSIAQRHELRQEKSVGLVTSLREELKQVSRESLPAGALGKAASYTLSLWPRLVQFLEHPELELSNNLAENSMRGVALGRKNWIHIGSEAAGPKVAALLSVIETCRRLDLSARDYLLEILPGLAACSIQRLAERTPGAWRERTIQA